MKQNDYVPNLFDQKGSFNERIRRQTKPSEKPVYSPRMITRKKQKKQLPVNPFARRKTCQQTNSVLRYMSFKRGQSNEDNLTFLSDEYKIDYSQIQSQQQSMFNLNFSRINSQQISQYTNSPQHDNIRKNLFEDIINSSKELSIDSSSRCEKKKSERFLQREKVGGQQYESKSQLSLETMSESPNIKESGKLEDRVRLLVRENKVLKRGNQQLLEKNALLAAQNQSLTNLKTQLEQQMQQRMSLLLRQHKQLQNFAQSKEKILHEKVTELQQQLTKRIKQIHTLQHQLQLSQKYHLNQLQQSYQMLQKQCLQKDHYLKCLHEQIQQLRIQNQQKHQYSNCLEDVILQLNGKIDNLRSVNEDFSIVVQEKSQKIEFLQSQREAMIRTVRRYEEQVAHCGEKIMALTQIINHNSKIQQQQQKNQQFQQTDHQSIISHQIIQELHHQITTLHCIIDQQKQHNEKLKKQISYKLIQLDFLKKGHYQHQRDALEIKSLKQKNKKLTKKLNHVIEEFQIFKQKASYVQKKKTTKIEQIKKPQCSVLYKEDDLSSITEIFTETEKVKQRVSNRVNNHQIQVTLSDKNIRSRNFRFDSDDQLSFKLSPEKF